LKARDVFISHSVEDGPLALAVCAALEAAEVGCWIAPRNVTAGKDWAESILDGIESARILLLVLSAKANESQQVKREVERAVAKGLQIITWRAENIVPSRSLEYFVSSSHWLDGSFRSATALPELVNVIKDIVDHDSTTVSSESDSAMALRQRLAGHQRARRVQHLVGSSAAMRKTLEACRALASCDDHILIMGESGVGKELAGNLIHRLSIRGDDPIFHYNCCSWRGVNARHELFGWEQGAFTGADTPQVGLIEAATNGSLFLDECEQLERDVLLPLGDVFTTGLFRRAGSQAKLRSRARFIAMTNADLPRAVADGRLPSEFSNGLLLFRQLVVPPLRDRKDDIPLLVQHFIREISDELGRRPPTVSRDAMIALNQYDFPRNVRELRHNIEYALFTDDEEIRREHLLLRA
jgi:DNA-binding NtrC family response regulator